MDQSTPEPGWYDDPEQPGSLRWWDGQAWTDHRRPLPTDPPPTGSPAVAGVAAGHAVGSPKIDTWLWQSIVVTVLCCLPLGIVGIVMASQAQTALNQGDVAGATDKARQARTFTLIGGGIGLLFVPVFFLWIFAAASFGM